MKLLIIETDPYKRDQIARHFSSRDEFEFTFVYSLNSAIKYIDDYWWKLSGIILSLGLTTDSKTNDYDSLRGLDLIDKLHEERFPLPILINSDSQVFVEEMAEDYFNVYEKQMHGFDANILDGFLETL